MLALDSFDQTITLPQTRTLLVSVCRKLGIPQSDEEDIIQSALYTAHRRRSTFDPARNINPWLKTILINQYIDVCRTRQRKPEMQIGNLHQRLEEKFGPDSVNGLEEVFDIFGKKDRGKTPYQTASSNDQKEHLSSKLSALIATLPEKNAAVIRLFYFQRCTYTQITEIEGIPLGTVKSRLSQSIALLRERFTYSDRTNPY
jgi:RNA polymerase sigma-70 factor, ECF subfamily